jgi:hypothetical protein
LCVNALDLDAGHYLHAELRKAFGGLSRQRRSKARKNPITSLDLIRWLPDRSA